MLETYLNGTTNVKMISTAEKNGAITIPAKKTWPALSKMFAKRKSSSFVKTSSPGSAITIKLSLDDF